MGYFGGITICVLSLIGSLCYYKSNFPIFILSPTFKECTLRKNIYSANNSILWFIPVRLFGYCQTKLCAMRSAIYLYVWRICNVLISVLNCVAVHSIFISDRKVMISIMYLTVSTLHYKQPHYPCIIMHFLEIEMKVATKKGPFFITESIGVEVLRVFHRNRILKKRLAME